MTDKIVCKVNFSDESYGKNLSHQINYNKSIFISLSNICITDPFEIELQIDASLEDLKDAINDELGLIGDDNIYVRNGDDSIFSPEEEEFTEDQDIINDKENIYDQKVIETLEPEEEGGHTFLLDCELKRAGARELKFYIRNATKRDLEIHVSYESKIYTKDTTQQ